MAEHKGRTTNKVSPAAKPARKARAAEPVATKETGGEAEEQPLRPNQCRAYMRNALALEFRGIVDGFVKGAKSGSCQHVKLANELVRMPERKKLSGRGQVQRLVDRLEREGR